MIMIAFTIALGASLATAMLNVMFDVGDKVNQELKTYGANIRVVPQTSSILSEMYGIEGEQSQYLKEEELALTPHFMDEFPKVNEVGIFCF